jgi:hypothetical protein
MADQIGHIDAATLAVAKSNDFLSFFSTENDFVAQCQVRCVFLRTGHDALMNYFAHLEDEQFRTKKAS